MTDESDGLEKMRAEATGRLAQADADELRAVACFWLRDSGDYSGEAIEVIRAAALRRVRECPAFLLVPLAQWLRDRADADVVNTLPPEALELPTLPRTVH